MLAEIITIGDEILIGQIVDTNSAWLGQQLNPRGFEITRITTIPDRREAILEALELGSKRSDLVIFTGGLGPTKDDITKKTLCEFYNVDLVFDDASFKNVERIFNHIGREITQVNKDQALIPSNSIALLNRYGTAPGIWIENNDAIVVSLPGVPYEMKDIMLQEVFPRIENRSTDIIEHATIVVSGMPESVISEKIEAIELGLSANLKLAYLPNYGVVRLRISARGKKEDALRDQILKVTTEIRSILGQFVIASEDKKIQEIVGEMLINNKQTVSLAESCTGGYVAHLITSTPGSSAYFPGSVVTYSYENKTSVLGVDADLIWNKGAVSQEVVEKMSNAVRLKNNTDYGVAISGIAGPGGGTDEKPVGTVWMSVSSKTETKSKVFHLRGDREQNIERSGNIALEMLRRMILNSELSST